MPDWDCLNKYFSGSISEMLTKFIFLIDNVEIQINVDLMHTADLIITLNVVVLFYWTAFYCKLIPSHFNKYLALQASQR